MNPVLLDATIDNPDKCESYHVERVLDGRTSANVFLAKCSRGRLQGRYVAIKLIAKEFAELTRRQAMNPFHHPALISLYACFPIQQDFVLVMEYCDSRLCQVIKSSAAISNKGPLPCLSESEIRHITRRLTEALAFLHSNGIVHGGVTPHNVFLMSDGRVKLKAIGIPKINSKACTGTCHEEVCRVSNYFPPDFEADQEPDTAWDMWSLGCLIVCLLTRSPPTPSSGYGTESYSAKSFSRYRQSPDIHKGISNNQETKRIRISLYEIPSYLALSGEIRDLMAKLLAPNPEFRISSSHLLSHAFLQVAASSGTSLSRLTSFWKTDGHESVAAPHEAVISTLPSMARERHHEPAIPAIDHSDMALATRSTDAAPIKSPTSLTKRFSKFTESSSGIRAAWQRLSAHSSNNENRLSSNISISSSAADPYNATKPFYHRRPLRSIENLKPFATTNAS
ncbi:hypothetical protein M422DRAFT_241636 [Sphaerobolus stellatus SS14]|nr:hypothetical protein M422DRAFT_241636 [Sphaerobolus stellatus SS14]